MAKITKIDRRAIVLPSKKRAATYARVSIESEELMQSLSAQISHYSARIQGNPSWEYAGVYAETVTFMYRSFADGKAVL